MKDFFYIMVFHKHKPVQMSDSLRKLSLYGHVSAEKTSEKKDKSQANESEQQPLLKPCMYKKR